MLGRSHVLSGAAAYNALTLLPVAGLHPNPAARAAYSVIAAGAASLCDLDSCGSTAARSFGWVSGIASHLIRWLSGGHRKGTHSLLGVTLFTAYTAGTAWLTVRPSRIPWPLPVPASWVRGAAAVLLGLLLVFIVASMLEALRLARRHVADLLGINAAIWIVTARPPGMAGLVLAVTTGIAAHIAGDMITEHGCPLAYPWNEHRFHLVPRPMQIKTGHWPERIIAAGLAAADLWFAWTTLTTIHL